MKTTLIVAAIVLALGGPTWWAAYSWAGLAQDTGYAELVIAQSVAGARVDLASTEAQLVGQLAVAEAMGDRRATELTASVRALTNKIGESAATLSAAAANTDRSLNSKDGTIPGLSATLQRATDLIPETAREINQTLAASRGTLTAAQGLLTDQNRNLNAMAPPAQEVIQAARDMTDCDPSTGMGAACVQNHLVGIEQNTEHATRDAAKWIHRLASPVGFFLSIANKTRCHVPVLSVIPGCS